VNRLSYVPGKVLNFLHALDVAKQQLTDRKNGPRNGVPKIVYLISSGKFDAALLLKIKVCMMLIFV
jgi:hypothetical protein